MDPFLDGNVDTHTFEDTVQKTAVQASDKAEKLWPLIAGELKSHFAQEVEREKRLDSKPPVVGNIPNSVWYYLFGATAVYVAYRILFK